MQNNVIKRKNHYTEPKKRLILTIRGGHLKRKCERALTLIFINIATYPAGLFKICTCTVPVHIHMYSILWYAWTV